jgi:hypothetical protein
LFFERIIRIPAVDKSFFSSPRLWDTQIVLLVFFPGGETGRPLSGPLASVQQRG